MTKIENSEVVENVKRLVDERAKKYDCGLRTAFIQWTSAAEKRGVSYEQLKEREGRHGKII